MDIVERLRTYSTNPKDWDEAADEIEQLRIDVAFLAKLKGGYEETIGQLKGEADRLCTELTATQAREAQLREMCGDLVTQCMDIAFANGANSVSMPDEYVRAAAFLATPTDDSALRVMIEREVERRLTEADQYVTNDASREEYGRQERAKERERCAQFLKAVGFPTAAERIRNLGDEK